jgi:hypothetical protein
VIDDVVEGLKTAIMVETTALPAPQSGKRRQITAISGPPIRQQ